MLDRLTDGLVCMCAVIEPNFPSKYAAIFERTLETLLTANGIKNDLCIHVRKYNVHTSLEKTRYFTDLLLVNKYNLSSESKPIY